MTLFTPTTNKIKIANTSKWLFAIFLVGSYLYLSICSALAARPTGDDYCSASIIAKSGFSNGTIQIFANTPFPVGVTLVSIQGAFAHFHLSWGTIAIGIFVSIFTLLTTIYAGAAMKLDWKSRLIFAGASSLGIWIAMASTNGFTPLGGLVISGGWVASVFHYLPLIALIGVGASIYKLVNYGDGFIGFLFFSFFAASSGNIGWTIYIAYILITSVFIFSFKSLRTDNHRKILIALVSGLAISFSVGIFAFVTGAVSARSAQAGISNSGLLQNLFDLANNQAWVISHYLGAQNQLIHPSTYLTALCLGAVVALSTGSKNLCNCSLFLLLAPLTVLSFVSPLIVVIWEGISYEGWWHFPSLLVLLSFTSFLWGTYITSFIGRRVKLSAKLIAIPALLSAPLYFSYVDAVPNLIALNARAASWDTGTVSPVAYLADRGIPWVDECFEILKDKHPENGYFFSSN